MNRILFILSFCLQFCNPFESRPNRNNFGNFFKRGNRYNGRNHLFYDKEEVFNNEIRHERRTKKNNNHIKQTFNSGREYYDNQSGRPVYKYFKKFPNYGYGRKRRSAKYVC